MEAVIPDAGEIADVIEQAIVESAFSGVVRVDVPGRSPLERAAGYADRRWSIPMTTSTRLSIASGTKTFTALVVMSLVESGTLTLTTTARSLLGHDLPLIDDRVTVEHLLAHRSGIGDYFDEDAVGDITDYVMPIPVHRLATAESYLAVLDGFPQVFPPGTAFAYNNGGFVVLALMAERAAGRGYHELVDDLVVRPAGLFDTAFIRCDSLPAGVATGYLDSDGLRTNSLHLPLLGVGDGGLFSTVADMARFWEALYTGGIVSTDAVRAMTEPRSRSAEDERRYGLGFWLDPVGPGVALEGYDAGISFRSVHDPSRGVTYTVIANFPAGAWGVCRALRGLLGA
jgi:CubicO group peptidase (beta-lactamase class C family)